MHSVDVDLSGARILLVDDTQANLDVLCALLEAEGCKIFMAPEGGTALRIAERVAPDLILLDVMMPGLDGFEVCRRLKQEDSTREIPVVFITADDKTEGMVNGFVAGGVDYIAKPFRNEEVLMRVHTHLRIARLTRQLADNNEQLARQNRELEEQIARRKALSGRLSKITEGEAQRWGLVDFAVNSPTMERIIEEVQVLQEKASVSVLIAGERGTGKELVARAIHFGSSRSEGAFVPVHCGDLPREVVESMEQRTRALSLLFGHVQGAFAAAEVDRDGYFQMAHEGTIFLDEIGRVPLPLQSQLLRVLKSGEVRRIGERDGRPVDVRVLAATSLDLEEQVRCGEFRQDFYDYLAQSIIEVPPLRQRREDIALLAQHFARLFMKEMGQEAPALSEQVIEALRDYSFPGNVRELKNMVERALIESGGGEIRVEHLHLLSETVGVEVGMDGWVGS